MIILDAWVLFFVVPVSMWIMKTFKKDMLTLLWIIPWSLLLFFDYSPYDMVLFILGLILGILTDLAGVLANKWWYPHYSNRIYSLSAFWGWGIITLAIFRFYNILIEGNTSVGWIIILIFVIIWLTVEVKKGKTSLSNYWVALRGLITVFFLFISGDFLYLIVASVGAIYIEILGTELKIWIYYDITPSYIYLGTGYAQLSYFCVLITNFLILGIPPTILQIFLIILLVVLYVLEYYKDLGKNESKKVKKS